MDIYSAAERLLQDRFPSVTVLRNEPMSRHTSFRIGGPAPFLAVCDTPEAISEAVLFFRKNGIEPLVIGNGTNLLVEDSPLSFPVIQTHSGQERITALEGDRLYAPAGVSLAKLAAFAMKHSLSGFEFAHGIPGSLGGAVFMNAGAYGGEMADVTERTDALGPNGAYSVEGDGHAFSYRHSAFSQSRDILLGSVIRLRPGHLSNISERMAELSAKRRASQPLDLPSAGSTFKRPVGGYAAALIDGCGLKGFRYGGAGVSEKHAGFVVNNGDATFSDVLSVMAHVQETVYRETGISLEPEIKIIRSDKKE